MALYEQSELDERLEECARLERLAAAGEQAFRKIQADIAVIAQWLRVLEFRLRYSEDDEEDGED